MKEGQYIENHDKNDESSIDSKESFYREDESSIDSKESFDSLNSTGTDRGTFLNYDSHTNDTDIPIFTKPSKKQNKHRQLTEEKNKIVRYGHETMPVRRLIAGKIGEDNLEISKEYYDKRPENLNIRKENKPSGLIQKICSITKIFTRRDAKIIPHSQESLFSDISK